MRLRTTSSGFVWEVSRSDPFQALLYDFDVGHSELKSEHQRYLDNLARHILAEKGKAWRLTIEGRASRTGSDASNMTLSGDRAQKVFKWLSSSFGYPATKDTLLTVDWVGESKAATEGEPDHKENMFYRSVAVTARSEARPVPPPIKIRPPKPELPSAKKPFRMRMTGGRSVALSLPFKLASISQEVYELEVWDVEDGFVALYRYEGSGKSLGAGPIELPLSPTIFGCGDWNAFSAPRALSVDDFAGPAVFESVGVDIGFLGPSIGRMNVSFWLPHWYSPAPAIHIRDFKTGESATLPGAGISSSNGIMELVIGKKGPK